MKWLCFVLLAGAALAQDITFTNKTMTFTNLEGRVYTNVTLVKANRDGIIWRGDGAGLVSFTNLSSALLESLGIPGERIEQAKARAAQRAASDAQRRAAIAAQSKVEQEANAKWRAEAPARAREAQRKADLEAIKTLEAQIEVADSQVRHADAVAPTMAGGDPAYVEAAMAQRARVNLASEDIADAKIRLKKMKDAYAEKYSK
jgi:hypothetical protein